MLWRRSGVVAGVLVAVLAVAGCGDAGLTFKGYAVSADAAFVGDIEQRFRDDTEYGPVKVGDGAHCWLLRNEGTGELDQVAACGPVRHLGAADPGVWDLYTFTGTLSGTTMTVTEVVLDKTGQGLPADREPYRGDDAKIPANADAVAAPDPPPARAGMARVVDDVPLQGAVKPDRGKLVVPGASIAATEVGELETIPGDEQSPLYRPADGEEFRAIRVEVTPDSPALSSSLDLSPAYSVKAGTHRSAVDLGAGADPRLLVVSVPKGADAELVVRVAGVDQSMSVRTGDRTSVTAGAYYRDNPKVAVGKAYPVRRVAAGSFRIEHRLTFTDATVTPFDPVKGWAPAGQLWLELGFTGATTTGAPRWIPDASRQLTAVDDKHRRTRGVGPVSRAAQGSLRILVAEDAGSVQLSYAPAGTFAGGRYAFAPLVFRVTLPQ